MRVLLVTLNLFRYTHYLMTIVALDAIMIHLNCFQLGE